MTSRAPKSIGKRLVRTREALGYSQAQFCREIGIERNQYNPFEKGRRRITVDVALLILDRFEISLDWIYAGRKMGLPAHLHTNPPSRIGR